MRRPDELIALVLLHLSNDTVNTTLENFIAQVQFISGGGIDPLKLAQQLFAETVVGGGSFDSNRPAETNQV